MRIYVIVKTKKKNVQATSRAYLIVMVVNPRDPIMPLLRDASGAKGATRRFWGDSTFGLLITGAHSVTYFISGIGFPIPKFHATLSIYPIGLKSCDVIRLSPSDFS